MNEWVNEWMNEMSSSCDHGPATKRSNILQTPQLMSITIKDKI